MQKKQFRFKAERIRWSKFTRRHDAIFRSLGKEMSIGVLSVSTLLFATPDNASAKTATNMTAVIEGSYDTPTSEGEEVDSLIELKATEVIASRAPIPSNKAVRIVQVINREDIEASSAQSVNDLLKISAGVDVRQRGGFGIQTDIGINGGNSDQLTVLINGVNITNPHTGHLTADFPLNIDDIERIEIIEGGASRVYGSSAFSGAVNIITKKDKHSNINAHVNAGSYGTWGGNAGVNLVTGQFTNRVSGGYTKSDGNCNNDFEKKNIYYNGQLNTDLLDVKIQLGASGMDYGANTFYGTGSNTQYEENERYMASAQAEYKGRVRVTPQVYWNRSYDHYVWWRAKPEAYQNFHMTSVYGANINAYTTWALGKTALGFEYRNENIFSTRLGKEVSESEQKDVKGFPGQKYKYKDERSNYGIYLEHDVILNNVTCSFGVLANKNTSVSENLRFYPGVDVSWTPIDNMRLYASFNKSLRTPTFTDLYYNGPGIKGNSELKPEKSTDFSVGVNYRQGLVTLQTKGFYRKGTDMIDWVKREGETVYSTANSDIDDIGAECLVNLDFRNKYGKNSYIQSLTLSYCYNYKHRVDEEQAATYVNDLTFLRHKFVTSLNHRIAGKAYAQWDLQMKNRNGEFDNALTGEREKYGTFTNVDLKLYWQEKNYNLYLAFNNLTNHKYYDVANVQQPGMWFMGGIKVNFDINVK